MTGSATSSLTDPSAVKFAFGLVPIPWLWQGLPRKHSVGTDGAFRDPGMPLNKRIEDHLLQTVLK